MCVYIYVCKGCLDKYISAATWPPKQKFLAPPLHLTPSFIFVLTLTRSSIKD